MFVNTHPSITSSTWSELGRTVRSFNDAREIMKIKTHGYETPLEGNDNQVKPIVKLTNRTSDYTSMAQVSSVSDLLRAIALTGENPDVDMIWLNDGIGVWITFNANHAKVSDYDLLVSEADVKIMNGNITMIEGKPDIVFTSGNIALPQQVIDLIDTQTMLSTII